jgi:putative membrane protein
MSKVMPITGALAVAMFAAAPGALAQDSAWSPWRPSSGVSSPTDTGAKAIADTAIIRQTIRGNYTEVGLGRLAESRADNEEVKEFAKRMVSDHNSSSMNQQWGTLAQTRRMSTRIDFGPEGQETIDRLEDLDGAEFDQAYMAEMIRHHEENLATMQRVGASSARAADVRQVANSAVPGIRAHLTLARQVGSRIGISTTAGNAGGVTTPRPPADTIGRSTTADRTTTDDRDQSDDRNRRPLRAEDRTFVQQLLADHLMHVRLANRAQREAKSDDTKDLAERIERNFTRWAERWENFADRRDANVNFHLERQHRQKLERLEKAEDRNYDRAYAAIVAEHLESLLPKMRKEGNERRAAGVGRLAEEEIPLIRELLAQARRVERNADNR